ncbi:MAG: 2-phosphosulfolactate phosphatase [Gemmatimonadales bacterium]
MSLDVVFAPLGLRQHETGGRTVFVIDVLRATTTICAAFCSGARAVVPVGSTEEALRLAQTLDRNGLVLAGEQNCVRIPGFDLGNSPLEMTETAVQGKTLVMRTSNGTRTLLAVQGAAAVYCAAAVNLGPAGQRAREVWERDRDLLIVCSGREDAFSLDDAYCAGRLAVEAMGGRRRTKGLNDSALACLDLVRRYGTRWDRPLRLSRAGRELIQLGFAADLEAASRVDAHPVLPVYHDRRVTVA